MQKWEHQQVTPAEAMLAGADGWEAVASLPFASGVMVLMKRPLVEKALVDAAAEPKRKATRKKAKT